jgi:4-amino-4-deoxy-L-arabinose transferase-like glycosyltransferase
METGRRIIAVVLGLVGLTALVSPEEFAYLFLGLSSDRTVHAYTWLQLEIAVAGLLGPAVVLFVRPNVISMARRFGSFLLARPMSHVMGAVLIIGLIVRVIAVVWLAGPLQSDAAEYDRLGWTLAETGCYCEAGFATAYRAPGFPFFLALVYRLFGHAPSIVLWLQIGLGLMLVPLGYGIARRLSFSEQAARLTAILAVLFPGLILYTNLLLSETLFVGLLALGIWLCLSGRMVSLVIGGVILGAAVLTRPIALLVPVVMVGHWWMMRRSARDTLLSAALVLAGMLPVLLPWMLRNESAVGRFTIATSGGVNFYIGNNPTASFGYHTPDPTLFDLTDPRKEAANDSLGYARGWQYIIEQPFRTLGRAVGKLVFLFAYDADPLRYPLLESDYRTGLVLKGLAVTAQACYLIALMFAVRSFRQVRSNWRQGTIPLGLILLVSAFHMVYFGGGRFHVPLLPFLLLLAAAGLVSPTGSTARQSDAQAG